MCKEQISNWKNSNKLVKMLKRNHDFLFALFSVCDTSAIGLVFFKVCFQSNLFHVSMYKGSYSSVTTPRPIVLLRLLRIVTFDPFSKDN